MLYQPSKQRNFLYTTTLVPVLCAALLMFSGMPVPSFFSGFAQNIATPLWSARDALRYSLDVSTRNADDVETLRNERDVLREELASLRRENFVARSVTRDMETLRTDRITGESREGRILAPTLFDMRGDALDMLVIGMGTDDGVRDRMLVTSPEGVALGYVDRAYDHSSHVRLFSSAHVSTGVVVYGTSTVQGLLEGQGAGTMTIQTPKDLSVSPGTIVGLPTLDGAGVGEVIAVETTPEDAFQTVYVRSPVNQYDVRYVLVDTTAVWEAPFEQPDSEPMVPKDEEEK